MSRPTKYTPERVAAICKDIERGNTFRTAALCNGITYDTLNEWRARYPEFSASITAAEAQAEANVVQCLGHQIHAGDTKAIVFYLTHRNNDGWRPPKATTVLEGSEDRPLTVVRKEYVSTPRPQ
jgi:hypothetical protein